MNVFTMLSDDKLYEICENLDLSTLSKFSRTSKRVQYVCGDILFRKQKDFLLSKLTNIVWIRRIGKSFTYYSEVIILNDDNKLWIIQNLRTHSLDPILPNMEKTTIGSLIKIVPKDNLDKLKLLYYNLSINNYEIAENFTESQSKQVLSYYIHPNKI